MAHDSHDRTADYDEDSEWFAQCFCGNRYGGVGGPPHRCPKCGRMPGAAENPPVDIDPIDPTAIGPGLTAIPLEPTPWDDAEDGQCAVDGVGVMWQRRKGLWHAHPWWQLEDAETIIAVCADPDEWAHDSGWTRKHIEDARGPLTYVTPPASTKREAGK